LKAFSQFLEIIFLIFSEKTEPKMLRTPRASSPASTREADSGVLGLACHTHRKGIAAFSSAMSSPVTEVTTTVLPATSQSQGCLERCQTSSALSSPACMAGQRQWHTTAGRSKPWWRLTKRAQAPGGEGDAGARDRRERKSGGNSSHARRPTAAMEGSGGGNAQ
jgi:hypothetical protein